MKKTVFQLTGHNSVTKKGANHKWLTPNKYEVTPDGQISGLRLTSYGNISLTGKIVLLNLTVQ